MSDEGYDEDRDDPKEFCLEVIDKDRIIPNGALLVILLYAVSIIICVGAWWFVLSRRVIQ